jgi:hypothetical protein
MSFRLRDTSSHYEPKYVEQETTEPVDEKTKTKKKKKGKEKTSTVTPAPVNVTVSRSGGFSMKHDATSQCDYL